MKYFVIGFLLCLIVVGESSAVCICNQPVILRNRLRFLRFLPGSSFIGVTKRLKELHIISRVWIQSLGYDSGFYKKIRVGEYAISCENTPLEILQTLASEKSITRPITFPEGYNMYEMAELVEKKWYCKKKKSFCNGLPTKII